MPNSGTVTAGSVALASQYNNLRSDVLDTSTGHVHSGSADAGAQIEATYLKSTGATSGQVLQADGSANSVWVTLSQAGAFTRATATFTFSTAAAEETYYNGVNNTANFWGVFTNGSTIFCIDSTTGVTTSRAARVFAYGTAATFGGSIAASSTASLALTVAGTVRAMAVPYLGFGAGTSSASTAVYYGELVTATSTGTISLTFKKYNLSLSANIWTANFGTNAWASNGTPIVKTGTKYMQEVNAWVTVGGVNGTALVYHVNDSTGAISSASFSNNTAPTGYVFVPSTGGSAAGTVHVWGTSATDFVRCSYAVTGTSITALATATNASAWAPATYYSEQTTLMATPGWGDAWYDRTEECIVIGSGGKMRGFASGYQIGIDRSFGTVLFVSQASGTAVQSTRHASSGTYGGQLVEKPFDHVSRTVAHRATANANVAMAFMTMGKKGSYYNPSQFAQVISDNNSTPRTEFLTNYGGMVGPGSALRPWIYKTSNFEFLQFAPLGFTEGTVFAASSVGRIITVDERYADIVVGKLAIEAEDAFRFNFDGQGGVQDGTVVSNSPSMSRFPMYLPAGVPLVVGFAPRYEANEAQKAGTLTVVFNAINLS